MCASPKKTWSFLLVFLAEELAVLVTLRGVRNRVSQSREAVALQLVHLHDGPLGT